MQKLDITREKTPRASERDQFEVRKERRSFHRKIEPIEPGRIVLADAAGVTTAMTPAYGPAPRGERVVASALASRESVTVIAAMAPGGVRPLGFHEVHQRRARCP